MAVPEDRLQELIQSKDAEEAFQWVEKYHYTESWAICDGALVVYDSENPPKWFQFDRDEDGNSIEEELPRP